MASSMSLMFRLTYAGHARGSHHKLALDALRRLRGPDSEAWRRLFLKHAETFTVASKVPDDQFKDFKNHVLHPRDGYWGGAPLACRKWYDELVNALRAEAWEEAVHAAGVLSHYVADPMHPFHTAQSEAENAIHRACEWSINRAYDSLRAEGEPAHAGLQLTTEIGPDWLVVLIGQGADKANGYYEKLIAHYDINTGVVDPPSGLDTVSRRIMAEMIHYAAEAIALVFERAIAESGVSPPKVSLTLEMLLATIKIPRNQLLKRLEDAADRAIVTAMYDELKTTGTVEATLPEDDRAVRDAYAAEVLPKQKKADVRTAFASTEATIHIRTTGAKPTSTLQARLTPASMPRVETAAAKANTPQAPVAPAVEPVSYETSTTERRDRQRTAPTSPRTLRTLSRDAALVDAPSIGPKTAARLNEASIYTVADLIAADPQALASSLDARWIGSTTIADWQAQARLACEVPGLTGTHAQILVGAGYRDVQTLADADEEQLAADVLGFATSVEGRRLLRDGNAPDLERIKTWVDRARAVRAA